MPQRQMSHIMKTCIVASHVHRGERGSVISECLVFKLDMFSGHVRDGVQGAQSTDG